MASHVTARTQSLLTTSMAAGPRCTRYMPMPSFASIPPLQTRPRRRQILTMPPGTIIHRNTCTPARRAAAIPSLPTLSPPASTRNNLTGTLRLCRSMVFHSTIATSTPNLTGNSRPQLLQARKSVPRFWTKWPRGSTRQLRIDHSQIYMRRKEMVAFPTHISSQGQSWAGILLF
jgi:hypothetical protein